MSIIKTMSRLRRVPIVFNKGVSRLRRVPIVFNKGVSRLRRVPIVFNKGVRPFYFILLLTGIILLFLIPSCGSDEKIQKESFKETTLLPVTSFKGEVSVYLVGPMVGLKAEEGQSQWGGAGLAAEELNSRGGIRQYKVVVKGLNDSGTLEGALDAARKIKQSIESGELVLGVIIHEGSDPRLHAVKEVYSGLNILTIAHSSDTPAPVKIDAPGFIRISATINNQALRSAELLKKLHCHRPAVVYSGDAYGRALSRIFGEAVKRQNFALVLNEEIIPGAAINPGIAGRIKKNGADGVFFAGAKDEAVDLLNDLYTMAFAGSVIVSGRSFTDILADELGCKAEGIFAVSLFPDPGMVLSTTQKTRYTALEFREPGLYTVAGYTGVQLIVEFFRKAGTWNAAAFLELNPDLEINTLIGNISFDQGSGMFTPGIYFFRIGGGRFGQALTLPPVVKKSYTPLYKSRIIVAGFLNKDDKPDSRGRETAGAITKTLKRQFKDDPHIEVLSLNKGVSIKDGNQYVRQLGEEHKALLVIWGSCYVENEFPVIEIRFELFDRPGQNRGNGRVAIAQTAGLGFRVQQWQKESWLPVFIHGIVQYWCGFYGDALADFRDLHAQIHGAGNRNKGKIFPSYLVISSTLEGVKAGVLPWSSRCW